MKKIILVLATLVCLGATTLMLEMPAMASSLSQIKSSDSWGDEIDRKYEDRDQASTSTKVYGLIGNLTSQMPEVRGKAAWYLGKHAWYVDLLGESPRVVDLLIPALRDENSEVRSNAAYALGEIGDPRAVDPLIAALRDQNFEVRSNSARAIGKIGEAGAVDPLIVVLREDRDKTVRIEAIKALRDIGDLRAIDPLIEALKDEDPDIRMHSVEALDNINDNRAVEPLIQALNDDNNDVREIAAESLGNFKDTRAVDPLIKAFKDPYRPVRYKAAEALGKIGDPRAIDPLIAALREDWIARAAAEALGKIGDPRAIDALKELQKTGKSEYDRKAASDALKELEAVDTKSETNQIVPTAQNASSQQNATNLIQVEMREEAVRELDSAPSEQKVTNLIQKPATPTVSLTTLNVEVASDVYSEKDRQVLYCPRGNYMVVRNRIYLTGTDIDKIEQVEYLLHPSFSNREAVSRDPTNDFEAWIWSWGGFPITATITTKSGQVFEKEFDFSFKTKFEEAQDKGIPQAMRCEE